MALDPSFTFSFNAQGVPEPLREPENPNPDDAVPPPKLSSLSGGGSSVNRAQTPRSQSKSRLKRGVRARSASSAGSQGFRKLGSLVITKPQSNVRNFFIRPRPSLTKIGMRKTASSSRLIRLSSVKSLFSSSGKQRRTRTVSDQDAASTHSTQFRSTLQYVDTTNHTKVCAAQKSADKEKDAENERRTRLTTVSMRIIDQYEDNNSRAFQHENESFYGEPEKAPEKRETVSTCTEKKQARQSKRALERIVFEQNLEILINFYKEINPERSNIEQHCQYLLMQYAVGNVAVALHAKYGKHPEQWEAEFQATKELLS